MNNYIKWFKTGVIGVVAIIGCNACSDDWNDHYDINSNASTSSLWQNISNNAKLTNFAKILESVKVSKSETRITNITYKDLLSSGSTFTVWAPENGTYNADSIVALISKGNSYNVEKDFIQNHIARFSHPATGTINEDITMYNSKVCHFAGSGSSYALKSTLLDMANSNVGSSNGTLHTLIGQAAFKPNLFELMSNTSGLDSLYKFFKDNETTTFSENASTQGPTIDGKPTYVDSVFYTSSRVSNALNASISNEDSLYAMVMPTNSAWLSGLEKTKSLFRYRKSYVQAITSTDEKGVESTTNVTTNINADSLQNYLAKFALVKAGVFNARYQNGVVPSEYTSPAMYDSLKTTTGLTLYNNDPVKGMTVASDIFDNQTPIEVSNGYAFITNNWKYRINKTIERDIDVDGRNNNIETASQCTYSTVYVAAGEQNPDVSGLLLNHSYIDFVPSTTAANPVATFKIGNVMSGTYDIYAVVVPENITNTRLTSVLPNRFKATLTYYSDATKSTTTTAISMESGNYLRDESAITSTLQTGIVQAVDTAGVATDTPVVTNKVDTVLLFRSFTFPISYYNLQNAYVTIKLQSTVKTKETKMYSREFRINEILFRAKDE